MLLGASDAECKVLQGVPGICLQQYVWPQCIGDPGNKMNEDGVHAHVLLCDV